MHHGALVPYNCAIPKNLFYTSLTIYIQKHMDKMIISGLNLQAACQRLTSGIELSCDFSMGNNIINQKPRAYHTQHRN